MGRDLDTRPDQQHLSTGDGIAIAGVWLAGAGLTALLCLVTFVWAPDQVLGTPAERQANEDGAGALVLLLLLALPMIAAFIATMRILGRD